MPITQVEIINEFTDDEGNNVRLKYTLTGDQFAYIMNTNRISWGQFFAYLKTIESKVIK